eukprot:SAG31_NODE_2194_length_6224_cov_3.140408_7_plen_238_part_00
MQDCGHIFCSGCVLQLLAVDLLGRCPLCRRPESLLSARRRFSLELLLLDQKSAADRRSIRAPKIVADRTTVDVYISMNCPESFLVLTQLLGISQRTGAHFMLKPVRSQELALLWGDHKLCHSQDEGRPAQQTMAQIQACEFNRWRRQFRVPMKLQSPAPSDGDDFALELAARMVIVAGHAGHSTIQLAIALLAVRWEMGLSLAVPGALLRAARKAGFADPDRLVELAGGGNNALSGR